MEEIYPGRAPKSVADLTFTYLACYLDPELQCGLGLVGLATNIKILTPKI